MQLSKSEQLMYSTLPIRTLDVSGYSTGTATGFMADFYDGDDPHLYCPALVTNRHVLSGCEKLQVKFTRALSNGSPDVGNIVPVMLSTVDKILHPDPNVDLGVIPLLPTIKRLTEQGLQPFCVWPHVKSLTPTKEQWDDFTAIEPVIMLGYPKGLMDAKNNHPIIRQGITATHPSFDYNGAPSFMVDMPTFPGCSGSPVYIFNEGTPFYSKSRNCVMMGGTRIFLVGVLHAIPDIKNYGSVVPFPTQDIQLKSVSLLPTNLGIVVKSTKLLDFIPLLNGALPE